MLKTAKTIAWMLPGYAKVSAVGLAITTIFGAVVAFNN